MRDQDLRYAIRVQDAQLKELQRNIRALNKDLAASERTASTAGAATATSYDKAGRSAKGAASNATLFGRSVKDGLKLGAGSFAAFATLEGVASILRGSVPAALEAERSTKRLETQLDNLGLASAENVTRIEDQIRASTLLAGVIDDELIRDSLVNLLRTTRNITKATELNNLAMDIAIAKNISLETASRLVARVYAGNTGTLGRYGIIIDKSATSTEALTILQDRFAGQAAAAGATAEGAFGKFAFRLEELQEQLGAAIIPLLLSATEVASDFLIVAEQIGNLTSDTKGLVKDLIPDVPGGGFLGEAIGEAREWGLLFNPQGPFKTASKVLDVLAGDAEEAAAELSALDRIAASVGASGDKVATAFLRVQQSIEKQLRGKMLDALEDVHEKALDEFDRQTDAMVAGHDKVTDSLTRTFDRATDEQLKRFDKTTDELVEKIRVTVKAGSEVFEIGRGQLTPAERELEALERLERKRRSARELTDARRDLGQAALIGDPNAIRDARARVQDLELEQRKEKLEKRAEAEREAADKAIEAEEERIRETRDLQRTEIEERRQMERDAIAERRRLQRQELADRRAAIRENLDKELAAQRTALEKGKRAAANAQKQILATLKSFGVDYAGVGSELGGKFLEGFLKAILTPPKQKGSKLPLLPGTIDPKTGKVVPLFPQTGGASGGLAGQLGKPGPSDTVVAGLTPGEMILTKGDQRNLARMLGTSTTGWPLLSKIRTGTPGLGFAAGGVVDEDMLRMLLLRFSAGLSGDAVERDRRLTGKAMGDKSLISGNLTAAQVRAASPVHIQSMLMGRGKAGHLGLSDAQRAKLGRPGVLELMGELAQAQAHPVRSGLVKVGPSGLAPGPGMRDVGDGGQWFGGPQTWNITGDNAGEVTDKVRRQLNNLAARNGRRRRGRNAGSIAGLRRS